MKAFGMLFFTAFIFSLFIFNEKKHSGRNVAAKQFSMADQNWERSYLNFPPNFPYTGLIHKPGHDGEYMQRLFGKLVQRAHKYSHEDWLDVERGYFLTYNNFLLLSLQVPMHESNLMHFTLRDPKYYCEFANNVLDPQRKEDFVHENETKVGLEQYEQIIKKIPSLAEQYKSPKELNSKYCRTAKKSPLVSEQCGRLKKAMIRIENVRLLKKNYPRFSKKVSTSVDVKNCDKLMQFERVKQMQFANDYADIGIFMFNSNSHPDIFTTNGVFDFNSVIDYGVKFLYSGYSTVAKHNLLDHADSYQYKESLSCFEGLDARSFSGRMFLMRGAWAGNYNSGKISKSCRIDEDHSAFKNAKSYKKPGYKLNDSGFLKSMAKFFLEFRDTKEFQSVFKGVDLGRIGPSSFHKLLPGDSIERKAFEEILFNVFYGKNKNTYLSQVLEKDYDSESEIVLTEESNNNESEFIETQIIPKTEVTEIKSDEAKEDEALDNEDLGETPVDVLDDVLDEVIVESTLIPSLDPREFTHILDGEDLNIRSMASYERAAICGNTKSSPSKVIRVFVKKEVNDFVELGFENSSEFNLKNECQGLGLYYIHKDYVKQVYDYQVLFKARLLKPVTLRDKAGKDGSLIIDYKFPSDDRLFVIGESILEGSHSSHLYVWYEIIRSDGSRGWFYSGKQGNTQKIEVLND